MEDNISLKPVANEKHIDRLYRTISLPDYHPNDNIRIKVLDFERNTVETLNQVKVDLGMDSGYGSRYRVRAKLSMAVAGVRESYWLEQKEEAIAGIDKINHYRIRGVSDKKLRSDWVYSNVKDDKNDTVLYELLHDILEVLLTANDEDLEYVIDTMAADMMQSIMLEEAPEIQSQFSDDEELSTSIKSASALLSSVMKRDFNENLVSSVQSFVELLRSYNVMDRFEEKQTDFIYLLLESFLEEKLDNIVKNATYEAILRNDEEIHLLLQTAYELDVKGSLINALYRTNIDDHFVSLVNDTVQLISEPIVYEEIVYKQNETYYNLFKTMLEEIYLPLLVLDQQSVLLESDLKDKNLSRVTETPTEIEYIHHNHIVKESMVRDIIELLIHDFDKPIQDLTIDFLEHIITPAREHKLSLWIEYAPVELIEYITSISSKTSLVDSTSRLTISEKKTPDVFENLHKVDTQKRKSLSYQFQSNLGDLIQIVSTSESQPYQQKVIMRVLDQYLSQQLIDKNIQNDRKSIYYQDDVKSKQIKESKIANLFERIWFSDHLKVDSRNEIHGNRDRLNASTQMNYLNVYLPYLMDTHINVRKDNNEVVVHSMPSDIYLMKDIDEVHYTTDSVTGNSPIGEFVLGRSTLQGR
ncbi:hypothetical protein [Oceanobacillus profundus]|uniref:Uncharacterized protein n=1 Tax=Oceanobacillus profundus TaxID=372463 RepID=A0A417YGQ6_9BACI|nr:hypothetical protein [Oceanobacillus profundus]RHW31983.1 hypothetical protein D1B32_12155 [Oceanobacillus profundus]